MNNLSKFYDGFKMYVFLTIPFFIFFVQKGKKLLFSPLICYLFISVQFWVF